MKPERVFLTARWENLVIISYKVPNNILEDFMPAGLEPDTLDGSPFVSLVAFNFLDTKVMRAKVPFNVNFPEINLRFYVKNRGKRGVVFIKEFVPKFFIAFAANFLYNENYSYARMKSSFKTDDKLRLNHTIQLNNKTYSINLEAENKPFIPASDSTEHFFKEHEWGFGKNKCKKTVCYRVEHPVWEVYPVTKFENTFDFETLYGKKWKSLNYEKPYNILYAKGSPVKVFSKQLVL